MKKYKIDNYQLLILNLEEFLNSDYMFDVMKLLKKRYKNITYSNIIALSNKYQKYILITKNKKLVGFTYNIYDMDLHITKFILNLNKNILKKIINKLEKIYKFVMITIRESDKKLMDVLLQLKFKEWNGINRYNSKTLNKGHKKVVLFNWSNPDRK